MKLKFNWGSGIAATYILFMIIILVMVFIFMNQDVSLESKDYYEKGIKYQEQIDKMNRTKNLPEQLDISVAQNAVTFLFPKNFKANELTGTISFFRPSDKTKDFNVTISADTTRAQSISTANLTRGLWKIIVDWNANGNSYFNEKMVMIN